MACALHAALAAGSQVDVAVSGFAASALGASRVGDICFALARKQKIESILVSDSAIIDAQRALWQNWGWRLNRACRHNCRAYDRRIQPPTR